MIIVNGENIDTKTLALHELLSQMKLYDQLCAVEVNKELVPHKEKDTYVLQDGDIVEIVTLVGGG
ncbi:MAG: sulfur carrier protein ThiS [Phycisphaerales bacterium]|nr:sulfur carrier protein ThiS [Planctomycetota bacterium]MBL6997641.1 sulfur carrier protein ThiS [Phycisphaerales bacterium]